MDAQAHWQMWLALAVNAGVVFVTLYRVGAFMGRMENRIDQLERRIGELANAVGRVNGRV
jgi:membrane protein implicated in regulation of membrane protease activity